MNVSSGQNHGLFLDMANGRRWVRAHVAARSGLRVLNLFAYTCAFSVVALQAGAKQVINLDMSQGALGVGQHNHRQNGLTGASFLAHHLFKTWGKVTRGGPYGLVIVELDTAFLQDQVRELFPEIRSVGRVDNPPAFADVSGERALKVLVHRAPRLDEPASPAEGQAPHRAGPPCRRRSRPDAWSRRPPPCSAARVTPPAARSTCNPRPDGLSWRPVETAKGGDMSTSSRSGADPR